jgi:hypothetical protein
MCAIRGSRSGISYDAPMTEDGSDILQDEVRARAKLDAVRAVPRGGRRWRGGVAISLAVHGAMAMAMLGTAWGVTRAREESLPVVLTADFEAPAPASGGRSTERGAVEAAKPAATRAEPARPRDADALAERLRALERDMARAGGSESAELDALARRFGALTADADAPLAPSLPGRVGASFAGLVAGNAMKVAYVVDASGSMVGRFPAIVDEVERSLMRLEPTQSFTVVCFRRDGAVAWRGEATLEPASRAARLDAVRWLRESIVPAGRSSPLEALALALRSGADCVFLLSTTITGPASHELDRPSMLALLDRLNPRVGPGARRRATIQCIQFLEEDPGGTLEAIAAEHAGVGLGMGAGVGVDAGPGRTREAREGEDRGQDDLGAGIRGYRFIPRSATTLDAAPAAGSATRGPRGDDEGSGPDRDGSNRKGS